MAQEFLSLTNVDAARLQRGIENAVALSFKQDRSRVTGDEARRRAGICVKLFRQLRGDLGWGVQRVVDHLPNYLRNELDGIPWRPDQRKVWVPTDG